MKQLDMTVAGLVGSATAVWGRVMALLLLLGLLTASAAWAQAPAWQSLTASGSVSYAIKDVEFTSQVLDGEGNYYVTGNYNYRADFSGIVLENDLRQGGFVAKWSAAKQQYVWATQMHSSFSNDMMGITLSNGAIYVVGDFKGPLGTFGSHTLASTMKRPYQHTSFVAKLTELNEQPTFVWATLVGGVASNAAYAVAAVGPMLYITGGYRHRNFETAAGTLPYVAGSGRMDGYVAKMQDEGTHARLLWAQCLNGTGNDLLLNLTVEGNTVLVAGKTDSETLTVGTTTLHYSEPIEANYHRSHMGVLLAKLQDQGTTATWVSAQLAGSSAWETLLALAKQGPAIYLLANTAPDYQAFGTLLPADKQLSAAPLNLVLTRFTDTSQGLQVNWSALASSPEDVWIMGLSVRGQQVSVTGKVTAEAQFGSFSIDLADELELPFVATLIDPTLLAARPTAAPLTLVLLPNPAHLSTTLHLPAFATPATFTLSDALSRRVRSVTLQPSALGLSYPLDLSGLAPGLYTGQLTVGSTQLTRRLVVE